MTLRQRSSLLLSFLIAVLLCLLFAVPALAQTSIPVTNGSFETGDLTGWTCTGCAVVAGGYVGDYHVTRNARPTSSTRQSPSAPEPVAPTRSRGRRRMSGRARIM